jgi:hypothetical protein
LSALPLHAQVTVEESITTDTVDIFAPQQAARPRSARAAFLALPATILLPGLGHQLLGNEKRAFIYFTSEALMVFSMVFSERYSARMVENAKSFAWSHAQTHSTRAPGNEYWKLTGEKIFLSSDDYNYVMELNGSYDEKEMDPDDQWYWDSGENQALYRTMRKTGTRMHVVSSFLIGGLILNRLISFIDVRIASRYGAASSSDETIGLTPLYSPADRTVGISLRKTLHPFSR